MRQLASPIFMHAKFMDESSAGLSMRLLFPANWSANCLSGSIAKTVSARAI